MLFSLLASHLDGSKVFGVSWYVHFPISLLPQTDGQILRGSCNYGPPADVYSFAIILWEIGTGLVPYSELETWDIQDSVTSGMELAMDGPLLGTRPRQGQAIII